MPLGTHLALKRDDAKQLFGQRDPALLLDWLEQDLLPRIADEFRFETANWELAHRLLTDGSLSPQGGDYPLNQCFLGARLVDMGETRKAMVIRPDTVGHIALALKDDFDLGSVATRLAELPSDYSGDRGDEMVADLQTQLASLGEFFDHAAREQCAVLFVI